MCDETGNLVLDWRNEGVRSRMCKTLFVSVCLTNVNDIYLFMSVLFLSFIVFFILINLLYTIKIDESWRLK